MAPNKSLAFVLGAATTSYAYFLTKGEIWRSTAVLLDRMPGEKIYVEPVAAPAPFVGPVFKATAIRTWNTVIDNSFQPLVSTLTSWRL
mmetsp:Transcript_16637/g.22934  ORF Transcript_16637/g.22934 Transcript_16637/m.22934 type:complete len:88 (-) Transcript_16637:285-548(-)